MVKCECVFHDGSRQSVMADKYRICGRSYILMQGKQQVLEVPMDWIREPDWLKKLEKVEDE